MSSQSDDIRPQDEVWFISKVRPGPGEVKYQRFRGDVLSRKVDEVKKDWEVVLDQVIQMVSASDATQDTGWAMGAVEIGLAFNAKGRLGFIAEAGVTASVKVTLQRR